MRKIPALLATVALAGLGALVPAGGAQAASPHCDEAWKNAKSGFFYAYRGVHCYTVLGYTDGNDPSWANAAGPFQGADSNAASSILHKGTSGMAVEVFNGVNYTYQRGCIAKSEYYASNLTDNALTDGGQGTGDVSANKTISSHRWVPQSDCGSFLS